MRYICVQSMWQIEVHKNDLFNISIIDRDIKIKLLEKFRFWKKIKFAIIICKCNPKTCNWLGSLKNRYLFLSSSTDWNSSIKLFTGLSSHWDLLPWLSNSHFVAVSSHALSSIYRSIFSPLYLGDPLVKEVLLLRISSNWIRAYLHDLILTCSPLWSPVFHCNHIARYWRILKRRAQSRP
jgi:hypothetical protein